MKELVTSRPLVLLIAGAIVMGALTLGFGAAPKPDATVSMGFWEAAARGFVSAVMVNETFSIDGHSETLPAGIEVTNTADVPVVISEEPVLMSPLAAQSPQPNLSNTTANAALSLATIPAHGSLLFSYGQYVLAGYLSGPMWWDLEQAYAWRAGVAFQIGGETLPFALRTLVEHPFYVSSGDNTQMALYAYLRAYPTVVVGKLPLWTTLPDRAGQTVRVRIDATNLAIWSTHDVYTASVNLTSALIADTVPAGWTVEEGSYSVQPTKTVTNADGSETLAWTTPLAAGFVTDEGASPVPVDYGNASWSYTLVSPALDSGNYSMPRAISDMNQTGTADAQSAPVIVYVPPNAPPVADAGGPYTGNEGDTILLDASASHDPDGDALQYRWSFTDNGTWDTAWSASPTASVTYTDEFSGQVRVEVTDGHTMTNATASVVIENVPPTVESLTASAVASTDIRLATAGTKGGTVTFVLRNGGTVLADLRVVRAPGDPAEQSATSGVVNVNLARPVQAWVLYTPPTGRGNGLAIGDNPTWLNLSFANGGSMSLFHDFNAQHRDTWDWSLSGIFGERTVRLQAHLFDPGSDAITARWDFGDGTSVTQSFPNGPAGDAPESPVGGVAPMDVMATVLHTYVAPGSYTITLTVTDGDGASTTATLTLQTG